MSLGVADYHASFRFKVNTESFKRIDRYLELARNKLNRFQKQLNKEGNLFGGKGLKLDKFRVNQRNLTRSLGTALDNASRNVAFEISRFVVNERNMRAALLRSNRSLARAGMGYQPYPVQQQAPRTVTVTGRRRGRWDGGGVFPDAHSVMWMGGGAGFIARSGIRAVPFLGGAYGLRALNLKNQEIYTTPLTMQAAVMAHGYSEQDGIRSYDWLKKQANDIGFSYMDAAPDFTKILANALGAGLDIEGSQTLFKGLNEYQTAMGVSGYRRNLINNAISQMLGKGTVQMEELKRQLGDSLPGTMAVFAEAWAEKSQSGLTGQQAINDLYAAVEKGQLVSADILPIVSEIMSRKAQPKLGIMKRSSIAEQARAINAMNELAETFSKGGGEQGFATMFREMHRWMPRLKPLVEGLGEGFKKFGEHVGTAFRIFTHNAGYLWDFKKTLDSVKLSMGGFELSLGNIAIAATAMLLPIGRLAAALGLIYLALDEINVAVEGGDAFLTPFFDWAEKNMGADRGILGITAGLVTLIGSVAALRKVKSWFAPLAEAGTAAGAAGGAANTAKTLGHTANAAKSGWGFLRLGNIFETLKAGAKGGLGFEFALNLMTNSVEDYENKWGFKRSDKIFGGYLINDLLIRITGSMAELGDTIIDIADFFAGGRIREFLDTSFNDGIWEISEWFKDKLSVLNQDWQFVKGWFGDISWVKNRDDTSWGMDAAGYGNLTKKVEAIPKDSGFRFFAPHTHNSNDPINKWQWERGINNGSSFDRALDSLSSPFSTNSNSTNNNDVNIEIKIDGSSNPQAVAIEVEKTLANIFANTNNSFGMA